MSQTINKGYELQATGSNAGTWGAVNNNDVIGVIDKNMGGIVTKSLTNVNVTLTADEAKNAIVRLAGTLTGAVQITNPCIGFYFIENLTTGSYEVTVTNGVSGVEVPQGSRATIIADTTNGCRIAGDTIASGTTMLFAQASAPTGWTKVSTSTYNDRALRVVTGTGGGLSGTADFSTVFTERTITQANLPNVTLSGTTSTDGAHTHTYTTKSTTVYGVSGSGVWLNDATGTTSSSGLHSHTVSVSLGGSATAMNFAVKYLDLILAIKG